MRIDCTCGAAARRRGSVLAETVLAMPLLLLLIFGVLQFALVWTARQMVSYAAFCAARAAAVVPPGEQKSAAEKAARLALAGMSLADKDGDAPVTVPGWGAILGSGSIERRTSATVDVSGTDDGRPFCAVTVKFKCPLVIAGMGVNKIIGRVGAGGAPVSASGDFYGDLAAASSGAPVDIDGFWPYIELTGTCAVPMPYSTERFPSGAFDGMDLTR